MGDIVSLPDGIMLTPEGKIATQSDISSGTALTKDEYFLRTGLAMLNKGTTQADFNEVNGNITAIAKYFNLPTDKQNKEGFREWVSNNFGKYYNLPEQVQKERYLSDLLVHLNNDNTSGIAESAKFLMSLSGVQNITDLATWLLNEGVINRNGYQKLIRY
jgi:hypothetical protein